MLKNKSEHKSLAIMGIFALLSFFFGGDRVSDACDRNIHYADVLVQCSDDVAVFPVRAALCSGDGNSFAPAFRPANSGRRVQSSTKSAFRIVKAGKVFDRTNFHAFLAVILQFQSGIRSNSRYIYSICQLLI